MARQDRHSDRPGSPADLATRLHSAAIHLLRRLRVEDLATGLTGPRLSALSVIVMRGPVTLGELARAEQVRPPTMSRLVRELVGAGLVESNQDPVDRRVQRIGATAKGRTLFDEGRTRRVKRLARDLEGLSEADFVAIAKAIPMIERIARPATPSKSPTSSPKPR